MMSHEGYVDKIILGECSDVMNSMPPDVVDLVVSSPPYDNLRDYSGYTFDFEKISKSLYRVMKPGGVVVWVVGDATIKGSESGTSFRQALTFIDIGFRLHDTMIFEKNTSSFPARRNGNRYTQIFDYMFVLSKGKPKTANLICDKPNRWAGHKNWGKKTDRLKNGKLQEKQDLNPVPDFSPRNNIWRFVVGGGFGQKDKEAYNHPGTFPLQLARDHILTWSNPGDLVLDPMIGSGTTAHVAKELGRRYTGIDISEEYCKLARQIVG